MSAKNQFEWIPFYEEFADKLLAYKDNREALCDKIRQVYEITGINMPTLDRNEAGEKVLVDIDPFTTFGLFNKGITIANRIKIITVIKDLFNVSAPVPTIFDGIPVLNPQKSTFYWFGSGRSEHDIDNLWDVFSYALALDKNDNIDNRENFQKAFDASLSQKGVKWNLSMGLYWIRPNRFLNLDSRNREFIDNNDSLPESIVTTVKSLRNMPNAEMYLKLCDDCIRYINSDYSLYNSIAELSYNAWNTSKEDNEFEKSVKNNTTSKARFLRWFKPLLQALKDLGGSATPKEACKKIEENENLTKEEISVVTGKNQVNMFENDVAFARSYLVKTGYIDSSTYGIWKLTETGKTVEMTDELASEISRRVVKETQEKRKNKGAALADDDVSIKRFWIYSPGHNASKWDECEQKGIMLIGWGEIGDLSNYATKAEMKTAMQNTYGDNKSYRNAALATWQFVNEMKPGDIVFAKKGRDTVIGRGVIESDYSFDENAEDEYNNVRKVKWTNIGEWEHPGQAAMKTLTDITQYTEYVETLNAMFDTEDDDDDIEVDKTTLNVYDKFDFLTDVYLSEDSYNTLVRLLRNKKNVILQGTPGVGKTFAAKRLAYSIMGVKDPERVELIQFHQSYTYEDFIEGFRPIESGSFKIQKGVFYKFCKKAEEDKEND